MASGADYGQKIPDFNTRNSVQVLATEVGTLSAQVAALSAQVTALSGHLATPVATLAIGTDTMTGIITNLRDLKASLVNANLLLP